MPKDGGETVLERERECEDTTNKRADIIVKRPHPHV